jgi:hypothetical protein
MLRFASHSKLEKIAKPVPGIVELTITQDCLGRVHWQGTTWPARFFQPNCQDTLVPGEPVKVICLQQLTLLVLPFHVNLSATDYLATGVDGLWN